MRLSQLLAAATEIFGVVGMASKNAIKDNFQALLEKKTSKGVVVKTTEVGTIAVNRFELWNKISEVSKIFKNVKFSLENQSWNH